MNLQRHPYRLFLLLGLLLSWIGVGQWILHAVGWLPNYRSIFHSMAQIQGFMTCFVMGFLFTAFPRRTGTAPPSRAELVLAAAAPPAIVALAWMEQWPASQVIWLLLMGLLLRFVLTRMWSGARRPPNAFIWIPASFGMGVLGSVLTAIGAIKGGDLFWVHDVGRALVLQSMFVGLVIGIGSMILPLLTRGAGSTDGFQSPGDWRVAAGHLLLAALLVGSFFLEALVSRVGGAVLRLGVIAAELVLFAGIWRLPSRPGTQRWGVWISAWAIVAGYAWLALQPLRPKAALHVVMIAGLALLAFSVGGHVSLAHSGPEGAAAQARPAFWGVVVLLLAAAGGRILLDVDPDRFTLWLGVSAGLFVAGTALWGLSVGRYLIWPDPRVEG